MGGIDTNIAAAALAISLVAFVTALGQLSSIIWQRRMDIAGVNDR
jgi:hypothetical protein